MRNVYRKMTGDPDDLHWLDYDAVAAGFDAYKASLLAHNPDLTDEQKAQLDAMLDGPPQFSVRLDHLPQGLKIEGNLKKVISFDSEAKRLSVDGKMHLLPKERAELQKQARGLKTASADDIKRFNSAVDQLFKLSSHLSYKERLAVLLKIDPERVGLVYRDDKTKEVVEQRKGKITEYKELLSRYSEELPKAREAFEVKHLETQWDEIQKLRSDLVAPVRALDTDFHQEARKLLTVDQFARGPVPEPWTPQQRIDHMTIWALHRPRRSVHGRSLVPGDGARVRRAFAVFLSRSSALAGRRRTRRNGRPRAQFHHQQEPDRSDCPFSHCLDADGPLVWYRQLFSAAFPRQTVGTATNGPDMTLPPYRGESLCN